MTYIPTILEVQETEKLTASVKEDLQATDKSLDLVIKLKKEVDEKENSRRDD